MTASNSIFNDLFCESDSVDRDAADAVYAFINSDKKKYIFGINEITAKIIKLIKIDGLIDEFSHESAHDGIPLVPISAIGSDALVLSVVIGRPLTVQKKLAHLGQANVIDYFSFFKYAGLKRFGGVLPLESIRFWEKFRTDFNDNREKYFNIYNRLADVESKEIFRKIVNFRLSYDLKYMHGFVDKQNVQYFEDFLNLRRDGEIFLDVGGFDGYTSAEFIKRCPNHAGVHIFEPSQDNYKIIQSRFAHTTNVSLYPIGLSDRKNQLRFSSEGSTSRLDSGGDEVIEVCPLDQIFDKQVTFLKMDIEGGELPAIFGASGVIGKCKPRMAISVYHKYDDLWRVPSEIDHIDGNYDLFLRHYTEGVDETVMFFMPN
jgi:FkbM family methyltransferase